MRASGTITSPTARPDAMTACTTFIGKPTERINSIARNAMRPVCSAGFAITVLPVTMAAATCPKNIANGKFHGLMHSTTPRASIRSSSLSSIARAA